MLGIGRLGIGCLGVGGPVERPFCAADEGLGQVLLPAVLLLPGPPGQKADKSLGVIGENIQLFLHVAIDGTSTIRSDRARSSPTVWGPRSSRVATRA